MRIPLRGNALLFAQSSTKSSITNSFFGVGKHRMLTTTRPFESVTSLSLLPQSKTAPPAVNHYATKTKQNQQIISQQRFCSSSSSSSTADQNNEDLVITNIDPETGIAQILMNRAPVNSLSLEMLQAISQSLQDLEFVDDAEEVKAIILGSTLSSGIFSAGLEITEMYNPNKDRLVQFWMAFQQLYLDLYYCDGPPVIAAIGGHAPAAGTMLALSCDYRIMVSKCNKGNKPPTIGLNETQLGITPPEWLAKQYIDTVGIRNAELGMSKGLLYTPEQALKINLIDEIYDGDNTKFMDHVVKEAILWSKIPTDARSQVKRMIREKRVQEFVTNRDQDLDFFINFVMNDTVQKNIGRYLERLAKASSSTKKK